MVKAWWVIAAFVAGGWLVMIIMACMAISGWHSEHERLIEESRERREQFDKEFAKWTNQQ